MAPVESMTAASSKFIVRREKKRSRRSKASAPREIRRGFVFQDATIDEMNDVDRRQSTLPQDGATAASSIAPRASLASGASSSSSSCAFVFRIKKMSKKKKRQSAAAANNKPSVDPAIKEQKEKHRARKLARLQRKREEEEAEARYVDELRTLLTGDQLELYQLVRMHVQRELNKTKKEFATSSARREIVQLTEKSLVAMKNEFVEFMKQRKPANVAVHLPNPENARLKALVAIYQTRKEKLDEEIHRWKAIKDKITQEPSPEAVETKEEKENSNPITWKLEIANEMQQLQQDAASRLGSSTSKLLLLEDSMKTIDRLILHAEVQKAKLFDTFHGSEFKGYANISQPKENLRALLQLAPCAQ